MKPIPRNELQEQLDAALDGVEGWLDPTEAWALHETARMACSCGSKPTMVEIGSYHGRSTISLAFGARAGGGGRVFAVDPQAWWPDQNERFLANVKRAGIEDLVEQRRTYSSEAAKTFPAESVDVLFIDGDHDYPAVHDDIESWIPKVAPGGVVAFNDAVWWDGVRQALRETIAGGPSAFRNPRWVSNTLFFDHPPPARWTLGDSIRLRRLQVFLAVAGRWARFHARVAAWERNGDLLKRIDLRLMSMSLRVVLPKI